MEWFAVESFAPFALPPISTSPQGPSISFLFVAIFLLHLIPRIMKSLISIILVGVIPFIQPSRAYIHHRAAANITWTADAHSFIVKLDLPGVPLYKLLYEDNRHWVPRWIPTDSPSAVLLNFTMCRMNHTLILNNHPFLPLPNPDIPPRLVAYQVPANITAKELDILILDDWQPLDMQFRIGTAMPLLQLDYDRLITPRDDPSITYYNPEFTLDLNLIGVTADDSHILLDVPSQMRIQIVLSDENHSRSDSPRRNYAITEAQLVRRQFNYLPPLPHAVGSCDRSSWRCPDLNDSPWYRYIWYSEFDSFGRIGSLRHFILDKWDDVTLFAEAFWPVALIIAASVGGAALLAYVCWRIYNGIDASTLTDAVANMEEEGLLSNRDEDDNPPSYQDAVKSSPPAAEEYHGPLIAELGVRAPPGHDPHMKPLPPSPRASIDGERE
ncbi:hypothetical protein M501DRAFT_987978 [Patellaria atrata CBS 101060]|uniref:Uncharacterized protein n=1 Tax=Patellaria atrata CBS 101060 TaxID=1346257 RepID=A0A9P4VMX0_9PEZI|nr:hypothetical protein M501DRAFT_987978 [Patellaria atrata CBS 101060]